MHDNVYRTKQFLHRTNETVSSRKKKKQKNIHSVSLTITKIQQRDSIFFKCKFSQTWRSVPRIVTSGSSIYTYILLRHPRDTLHEQTRASRWNASQYLPGDQRRGGFSSFQHQAHKILAAASRRRTIAMAPADRQRRSGGDRIRQVFGTRAPWNAWEWREVRQGQ